MRGGHGRSVLGRRDGHRDERPAARSTRRRLVFRMTRSRREGPRRRRRWSLTAVVAVVVGAAAALAAAGSGDRGTPSRDSGGPARAGEDDGGTRPSLLVSSTDVAVSPTRSRATTDLRQRPVRDVDGRRAPRGAERLAASPIGGDVSCVGPPRPCVRGALEPALPPVRHGAVDRSCCPCRSRREDVRSLRRARGPRSRHGCLPAASAQPGPHALTRLWCNFAGALSVGDTCAGTSWYNGTSSPRVRSLPCRFSIRCVKQSSASPSG